MAAKRSRRPLALIAAAAVAAGTAALAGPPARAASPTPATTVSGGATPSSAASGGDDAAQGGSQLAWRNVAVNYPGGHAGKRDKLPRVPASAFLVADAGTGQVLVAKDAHGWFRPASTR
jgi:D-alanyl-D-alanine carboxypeptidase (penicillin-binding protein 5/6)